MTKPAIGLLINVQCKCCLSIYKAKYWGKQTRKYCSALCAAKARRERTWISGICKHCGKPTTAKGVKPKNWCNKTCYRAFKKSCEPKKERPVKEKPKRKKVVWKPTRIRPCENCGTGFVPKHNDQQRFCCRKCGWNGRLKELRVCRQCDSEFVARSLRNMFCSRRCFKRADSKRHPKRNSVRCRVCKKVFWSKTDRKMNYCSEECSRLFSNAKQVHGSEVGRELLGVIAYFNLARRKLNAYEELFRCSNSDQKCNRTDAG